VSINGALPDYDSNPTVRTSSFMQQRTQSAASLRSWLCSLALARCERKLAQRHHIVQERR